MILFKAITEGKTSAEAAELAGYSTHLASHTGWQAMQRVKKKIATVMDQQGLTVDQLIETYLKPMLSATEVKTFKANGVVMGEDEEGNDVMKDGGVIYSEPLVAWSPRRDALDMSFKIHGAYAKTEEPGVGGTVNNNLTIINHIERPKRVIDHSTN